MRKSLVIILFTHGFLNANAQDSSTVKGLQLSNVYLLLERVSAPPDINFGIPFQSATFELHAKNREVFREKFQSDRASYSITALAGFKLRNREKTGYRKSSLIRMGISFSSAWSFGSSMHASAFRTDTLASPFGSTTYIDSGVIKQRHVEYYSDKVWLDLSFVFSTNPNARLTLYEGIGTSLGFGFNNRTKSVYAENKYLRSTDATGNESFNNFSNPDYNQYTTTKFKNQGSFDWSIYIPLGIDFRLGNKENFLKHVHLFYELRAGIIYNNQNGDILSGEYLRHQIGLRVKF